MPTLKIDGREVTVDPGATILQAAEKLGIEVPTFCYHPGLTIAANCRMCLVDTNKSPKPVPACHAQVMDGMEVQTRSARIERTRKAVLEFILLNHPVDCPICDQAGECVLQDHYFRYSAQPSRLFHRKQHKAKAKVLGPDVILDAERCILCTRCVRFCDEVAKEPSLDVVNRGEHSEITTFPGKQLDNPYAGNTVDICPVGALTSRDFRFKTRVWMLQSERSVCPECSRGCNVRVDTFENVVRRLKPAYNPQVNKWWMSDAGRLAYRNYLEGRMEGPTLVEGPDSPLGSGPHPASPLGSGPHPASPLGSGPHPASLLGSGRHPASLLGSGSGGRRVASSTQRALDVAANVLAGSRGPGGAAGAVAVVLTPWLTNEDAFVYAKLLERGAPLAGNPVYIGGRGEGFEDAILLRADKNPNRRGLATILEAKGIASRPLAAFTPEGLQAVLILGDQHALDPALLRALAAVPNRLVIGAFKNELWDLATVFLPARIHWEKDGSFTNFEGQVQRIRRATTAAATAKSEGWYGLKLGQALGLPLDLSTPQAIFEALAGEVAAFAGLSLDGLGEHGARLSSPPPQAALAGKSGATAQAVVG